MVSEIRVVFLLVCALGLAAIPARARDAAATTQAAPVQPTLRLEVEVGRCADVADLVSITQFLERKAGSGVMATVLSTPTGKRLGLDFNARNTIAEHLRELPPAGSGPVLRDIPIVPGLRSKVWPDGQLQLLKGDLTFTFDADNAPVFLRLLERASAIERWINERGL